MVFKIKVAAKGCPAEATEKELLFVRYYCTSSDEDRVCDLSFRHLEWECVTVRKGRSNISQPLYAVLECSNVLQRATICPHFALWDEGKCTHFLVNDVLTLWPRDELLPQRGFQHTGET